jgi:hypothetical protein
MPLTLDRNGILAGMLWYYHMMFPTYPITKGSAYVLISPPIVHNTCHAHPTHTCLYPTPTYVTISQVAVQNMSVATHKIMMRLSLAISKLDICTSRWPQHRVNGGGCEMMVQGLHG